MEVNNNGDLVDNYQTASQLDKCHRHLLIYHTETKKISLYQLIYQKIVGN